MKAQLNKIWETIKDNKETIIKTGLSVLGAFVGAMITRSLFDNDSEEVLVEEEYIMDEGELELMQDDEEELTQDMEEEYS